MKRIPIPTTLIATAALFLVVTAQAAEFCVRTSDELENALDVAADNGEADTIRIATGHYPVPPDGGFFYDARHLQDDNFDVTVSGNWLVGNGDPCGQLAVGASNTILDGGGAKRVMKFNIRDNTSLTVRGLTFRNGRTIGDGGGLAIYVVHDVGSGYTGRILVERNMFLRNTAGLGGGLFIGGVIANSYTALRTPLRTSRMGVVNNVFFRNSATRLGAAYLTQEGHDGGVLGVGIYVTNNTVLENTQSEGHLGTFGIFGNTPNVYVINNDMWGNYNGLKDYEWDLYVFPAFSNAGRTYRLQNNNIGGYTGMFPTVESGNVSVEAEYIPVPCSPGPCLPRVPTVDSPLVDAGTHPGIISPFWTMPALDAAGNPRIAQGTVDIGAYENHDRFFADRFESSN